MSNDLLADNKRLLAENERMRAALQRIAEWEEPLATPGHYEKYLQAIAREALRG